MYYKVVSFAKIEWGVDVLGNNDAVVIKMKPRLAELSTAIANAQRFNAEQISYDTLRTFMLDSAIILRNLVSFAEFFNSEIGEAKSGRGLELSKCLVGPACLSISELKSKAKGHPELFNLYRRNYFGGKISETWIQLLRKFYFFAVTKDLSNEESIVSASSMNEAYQELQDKSHGLPDKEKAKLAATIHEMFVQLKDSPKNMPDLHNLINLQCSCTQQVLAGYVDFLESFQELLLAYSNDSKDMTYVLKVPHVSLDGEVKEMEFETVQPKDFIDGIGFEECLKIYQELRNALRAASKNMLFVNNIPDLEKKDEKAALHKEAKLFSEKLINSLQTNPAINKLFMNSESTSVLERFKLSIRSEKERDVVSGSHREVFPFLQFDIMDSARLVLNSETLSSVIISYFEANPEEREEMNKLLLSIYRSNNAFSPPINLIISIGKLLTEGNYSEIAKSLNDVAQEFINKKPKESKLVWMAMLHILNCLATHHEYARKLRNTMPAVAGLAKLSARSGHEEVAKLRQGFITEISKGLAPTLEHYYGNKIAVARIKKAFELVLFFNKNPQRLAGTRPTEVMDAVMLIGTYGTGKTLLMECLTNEYQVPRIDVDINSLIREVARSREAEVATGAGVDDKQALMQRIHKKVEEAKKLAKDGPVILFFDECDAISRDRRTAGEEDRHITTMTLGMIEEIRQNYPNIFVVGATNHPDEIDGGVVRDGRFGIPIVLNPPIEEERRESILARLQEAGLEFSDEQIAQLVQISEELMQNSIIKAINQVVLSKDTPTFELIKESLEDIKAARDEFRKVTNSGNGDKSQTPNLKP